MFEKSCQVVLVCAKKMQNFLWFLPKKGCSSLALCIQKVKLFTRTIVSLADSVRRRTRVWRWPVRTQFVANIFSMLMFRVMINVGVVLSIGPSKFQRIYSVNTFILWGLVHVYCMRVVSPAIICRQFINAVLYPAGTLDRWPVGMVCCADFNCKIFFPYKNTHSFWRNFMAL